jgi:hypothetical protein
MKVIATSTDNRFYMLETGDIYDTEKKQIIKLAKQDSEQIEFKGIKINGQKEKAL